MRIAIGVLFYNKPTLTRQCLEAISKAELINERVYLIDNGSEKGVLTHIENDAIKLKFKNITSIRIPTNKGFGGGMNTALKAAFADHACDTTVLLSNDVFIKQDFLKNLKLSVIKPNEIHCPKVFHAIAKHQVSYQYGTLDLEKYELTHISDQYKGSSIAFPDYYPAAVTVWSKLAYHNLDGFNESFYCYWEDVELSLRAKRHGVSLVPRPDLEVHHLGRGTTRKKQEYSSHFNKGKDLLRSLHARTEL